MTLYLIEKAIKPQFTWADHPRRKLQTSENRGKNTGFGMIIFIGIAVSYNIPKEDIMDYLAIEDAEFRFKAQAFQDHWDKALARKDAGTLCKKDDHTDKLWRKTKLTLNALNSLERSESMRSGLNIR